MKVNKNIKIILCLVILFVSGCTSNKNEKAIVKKDKLIEIVIPNNLLLGNSAKDMEKFYKENTKENTPIGEKTVDEQMTSFSLNKDGFLAEKYTENQLEERKQFMYDAGLMKDMYSPEDSAIRKVEYDDKELTKAKVYVVKDDYEGGGKDSLNQFSRILVKIYITTRMGAYQVYNGVNPDKWKVHLSIYDVDTEELLHEYDYPTEGFPNIKI